ncbi:asparaginase domain-containing protein [Lacisediminimonas sp.]|uniref:asparaginase domain-containing protein n=1 Tax=Lacisediminimonas sp. TaxID=3060582 RepID=UPI0027231459|nr:asparaginase domain-containing protein [Lacisediminimonas sp.]MDO8298081.1 asparaginase domain-containing protein [Lacisediminimonas sp.]
MTLLVLATGGTFDKRYDEINGVLGFGESHLPQILQRCRITLAHRLQVLTLMDSLDMGDQDRCKVADACAQAHENAVVIIHGTDTMQRTAEVLAGRKMNKTLVLTGAMIPCDIEGSDALFNLGYAVAAARHLPPGVYVAMNGQAFPWNEVVKNRAAGRFERR